jgi:hypothetical protein
MREALEPTRRDLTFLAGVQSVGSSAPGEVWAELRLPNDEPVIPVLTDRPTL